MRRAQSRRYRGFNPRARVGRDSLGQSAPFHTTMFQSTRPRGARRARRRYPLRIRSFQSTRPRGARPLKVHAVNMAGQVSIHAPAWGATRITPHHGFHGSVSIHAPAWGATVYSRYYNNISTSFNPRARVGRDTSASILYLTSASFQSTRPRGARLSRALPVRGCRVVSIHAPAWGATSRVFHIQPLLPVSIHAPAWGATPHRSPNCKCFKPPYHEDN